MEGSCKGTSAQDYTHQDEWPAPPGGLTTRSALQDPHER